MTARAPITQISTKNRAKIAEQRYGMTSLSPDPLLKFLQPSAIFSQLCVVGFSNCPRVCWSILLGMDRVWIGTSGFDYREWKPGFYPADLPRKEFLNYYASRFPTVELNSTFYQMPSAQRICSWQQATPEGFRFTLKAPRRITHQERLKVPSNSLDYFVSAARGLGTRLGALLFQLPPFFKCDCGRLTAFLATLPRELPAALEFRHDSWFTDEVCDILKRNGVALCINDGDGGTTPVRLTCSFAYVRLRRSRYMPEQLMEWKGRIGGWVREGAEVFAYVKHEDNPDAPQIALEFMSNCRSGL